MEGFLKEKLEERKEKGLYREMSSNEGLVDFLSNDYLGLARSQELSDRINARVEREGFQGNGGTGSRLLSGNHKCYDSLENYLSKVFRSPSSLVFNSGYVANQGLIPAVTDQKDTILYDQLSHVCIKEGAWLSRAQSFSFLHNNLSDLDAKLQRANGRTFVITESVFSMDGDEAPLEEMIRLCKRHGAYLIVDEAHSTGVFGENGAGYLVEKGLEKEVFARVYTFGKGMGVHGACVAGSEVLIDYLINFGRSFIYTTSLPPHSILSIEESFRFLADNPELQNELRRKVGLFKANILTNSNTAVQPILAQGNQKVRHLASALRTEGLNVRPIVSPTVKAGTERLRICIHAFNTDEEINKLSEKLNELL